MLPKKRRLTKKDIQALFRSGKRLAGEYITLQAAPNAFEGPWKVSVSMSKKVFPKAHDRNRAKRRVFGVLKDISSSLPSSYALMFQIRADIEPLTPSNLKEEIVGLLEKVK
jgi:ribonuclease P protein component